MTDSTNTIDELMSLDPLSLTSENIDQIITHHRRARANAASGKKAQRETGPKIDIAGVMAGLTGEAPKPAAIVRRR
jgi:hypothetical protein